MPFLTIAPIVSAISARAAGRLATVNAGVSNAKIFLGKSRTNT